MLNKTQLAFCFLTHVKQNANNDEYLSNQLTHKTSNTFCFNQSKHNAISALRYLNQVKQCKTSAMLYLNYIKQNTINVLCFSMHVNQNANNSKHLLNHVKQNI